MATEAENLSTIRAYLRALEDGALGEALARYFTADVL
jgi:limonene-1,2-epoxide hydrolase